MSKLRMTIKKDSIYEKIKKETKETLLTSKLRKEMEKELY